MLRSKGAARAAVAALLAAALAIAARAETLGPETNLPLPRYVSLKTEKANVRRGPGLTHRIDWVFVRRGMPLEIVAEYGHWRKVRDVDDAGGWVHFAMLRGARSAVVTAPRAALREAPERGAPLAALAEAGVILSIEKCEPDWCEVSAGANDGWVLKSEIWGAGPDEVFD
ncbi:SH3 domain-containing protein [Pikeienuella sp. HZG-20]|uniref:SH3 domain-containing protein n=1 Tax=Paludibacillus litoralis TaxID=3133267 RepID=UPI0030EF577C